MKKYEVNWSDELRRVIMERLAELRLHRGERGDPEGFPWRIVCYRDNTVTNCITVNARLDERFGPTDWSLEIKSSKLENPLIVELGGAPELDHTIRGVADYFNHAALGKQGIDLSRILSKSMLSDLWLELVRWARKNKIGLSADVALLPPQSVRVYGRHGQLEFDDEVIPKEWGDVRKDEDQINVFFSNFWIGKYAQTNGTVFRLSSYLTKQFGISSRKAATRYIDFNPDDPTEEKEIRKLIDKASVVYLPDLSIKNVRSVFFESIDTNKQTRN